MKRSNDNLEWNRTERRSSFAWGYVFTVPLFIFALFFLSRCSVKEPLTKPQENRFTEMEIPRVDDAEFVVRCLDGRYTFRYDTTWRQARWVAHVLTRKDVETDNAERRNSFIIDPEIRQRGWPYAVMTDYANSGYDRGHLVPSADRKGSQQENDATFRMSNIAPQRPALNQRIWNNLEAELRRLARQLDTLWVVTGSSMGETPLRIGKNGVGVPDVFFKTILARRQGTYIAVTFLIPNREAIEGTYWDYAMPVSEAEVLLGIDFFPNLPDAIERQAEATFDPAQWR